MDFKDQIKKLGERVLNLKDRLNTEEATKNSLIMPFIQTLGYDIFDPTEVVPEFIADIGIKKGEKIDYAIFKDGKPIILIECKWVGENLDNYSSQLFRYFHTSKAKFSLLTNGIEYRFFTDLVDPNKMDEHPFLKFNIVDIKEMHIEELKKFHKSYFDETKIFNTASELQYSNSIKTILMNEMNSPSESFIKFFTNQVYTGRVTEKVYKLFSELVKKSFTEFISDIITDRLKLALQKEANFQKESEPPVDTENLTSKEEKTELLELEIESYYLIKGILRNNFDANRIFYRDFVSCFVIILDNSIQKKICRLWLNDQKKYIGIIDENKKEIKKEIKNLNDIYLYSEQLINTALSYNVQKGKKNDLSSEHDNELIL